MMANVTDLKVDIRGMGGSGQCAMDTRGRIYAQWGFLKYTSPKRDSCYCKGLNGV